MKKIIVAITLFLVMHRFENLMAQDLNGIPFVDFQLFEVYDSLTTEKCLGRSLPCIDFRGKLIDGITQLWGKDRRLVKLSGNLPYDGTRIYYHILSVDCGIHDTIIDFAKSILQKKYHFTTTIVQDSAEILILKIQNINSLKKFETGYYGKEPSGGIIHWAKDSSTLDFNNMPLNFLFDAIKPNLRYIIDDSLLNNKIYYTIQIPQRIVKETQLNIINKFLLENLGMELRVEKNLVDFLLIHFLKSP